jgi:hypothetical protein
LVFGDIGLSHTCPLLGVKQTRLIAAHMSAYDPKRTSPGPDVIAAGRYSIMSAILRKADIRSVHAILYANFIVVAAQDVTLVQCS